jgi:glutaredoxin-like protein NrdH
VKSWLKRHGGDFTVVDITKSPEDAEAIKALGYTKTPVLIVSNGDAETDLHWAGFNEDFLKKYCGKDAA